MPQITIANDQSLIRTTGLEIVHSPKDPLMKALKELGRVMLPSGRGYLCCTADDILYLKGDSNYTEVHYRDGNKHVISKTLKVIEDKLPKNLFYRIHHSYVINISHIQELVLTSQESSVKLTGGKIIPMSRGFRKMQFTIYK